jgi:hypothetical protein
MKMQTQTVDTIHQNAMFWSAIHTVSNEVADELYAASKRERRLKAVRRYLRERAAR